MCAFCKCFKKNESKASSDQCTCNKGWYIEELGKSGTSPDQCHYRIGNNSPMMPVPMTSPMKAHTSLPLEGGRAYRKGKHQILHQSVPEADAHAGHADNANSQSAYKSVPGTKHNSTGHIDEVCHRTHSLYTKNRGRSLIPKLPSWQGRQVSLRVFLNFSYRFLLILAVYWMKMFHMVS